MKDEIKKNEYKKYETPKEERTVEEPVLTSRMDAPTEGYVTTAMLNVRKAASKESEIIKVLYQGDKVEIVKESGEWYEIKPSGFVMAEFIK